MSRIGWLSCALGLLALAGCFQAMMLTAKMSEADAANAEKRSPRGLKLHGDEAKMKAELLKVVQPGMRVEQAKQVLSERGFRCSFETADTGPYLSCVASQFRGGLPVLDVRVAIDFDDSDKVTGITVETDARGPRQ